MKRFTDMNDGYRAFSQLLNDNITRRDRKDLRASAFTDMVLKEMISAVLEGRTGDVEEYVQKVVRQEFETAELCVLDLMYYAFRAGWLAAGGAEAEPKYLCDVLPVGDAFREALGVEKQEDGDAAF